MSVSSVVTSCCCCCQQCTIIVVPVQKHSNTIHSNRLTRTHTDADTNVHGREVWAECAACHFHPGSVSHGVCEWAGGELVKKSQRNFYFFILKKPQLTPDFIWLTTGKGTDLTRGDNFLIDPYELLLKTLKLWHHSSHGCKEKYFPRDSSVCLVCRMWMCI